ncbi:MAG: hypothetical protein DRJ42_24205 [Deltaproteobacteria bacterium]|nr:MAG: hypothetical protein DRJ42_24205 [Deltaproteobacteria bacterium]
MQAHKLITVVNTYPKALAMRMGIEKGYLLERYTAATPAADVALSLASANAFIGGKRIHRMTVADIRNATKRLTAAPKPTNAETKVARSAARRLQQTLRKKGASSAVVRAERQGATWKLRVEVDLDDADILGAG